LKKEIQIKYEAGQYAYGGTVNGLDLFSGIGGLTIALSEWVNPIAYCENDKYAQSVLLSRMSEGLLPIKDVTALSGNAKLWLWRVALR